MEGIPDFSGADYPASLTCSTAVDPESMWGAPTAILHKLFQLPHGRCTFEWAVSGAGGINLAVC